MNWDQNQLKYWKHLTSAKAKRDCLDRKQWGSVSWSSNIVYVPQSGVEEGFSSSGKSYFARLPCLNFLLVLAYRTRRACLGPSSSMRFAPCISDKYVICLIFRKGRCQLIVKDKVLYWALYFKIKIGHIFCIIDLKANQLVSCKKASERTIQVPPFKELQKCTNTLPVSNWKFAIHCFKYEEKYYPGRQLN